MFNIGTPELVVIIVIALIFLGPQQLPELAKSLGKFMREVKKATNEVNRTIQREANELHELHRETVDEVKKNLDIKAIAEDLSVANQEKPKDVSNNTDKS